jgi:hypothetical protein
MRKLRPTPAGVIACLALAIALGGSAFAATTLVPKNSVGSAQVVNGSLQKVDLSIDMSAVQVGTLTSPA